jgi:hypothetical protein
MSRASLVLILGLLLLGSVAPLAAAAGAGPVGIAHTPPTSTLPGQQIDLRATLTNATSASVLWNNGSLAKAATLPMTNTSQPQAGGWVYEAWLPAQADGTQVTYSIAATGPAGTKTQSYSLTVAAPSSNGITPADQNAWTLTMAATFSMAASTVVAIYYYVGLRLRREGA